MLIGHTWELQAIVEEMHRDPMKFPQVSHCLGAASRENGFCHCCVTTDFGEDFASKWSEQNVKSRCKRHGEPSDCN